MKNSFSYSSPLGKLWITDNGAAICRVKLGSKPEDASESETPLTAEAARQLREYFDGSRTRFDLPLQPEGTEFQKKVWNELIKIPCGDTISYKELALRIGNPRACRAVGMANNRNPIMIIVPCHRVVGADGSMTGYAGGIDKKEFLLALEKDNR